MTQVSWPPPAPKLKLVWHWYLQSGRQPTVGLQPPSPSEVSWFVNPQTHIRGVTARPRQRLAAGWKIVVGPWASRNLQSIVRTRALETLPRYCIEYSDQIPSKRSSIRTNVDLWKNCIVFVQRCRTITFSKSRCLPIFCSKTSGAVIPGFKLELGIQREQWWPKITDFRGTDQPVAKHPQPPFSVHFSRRTYRCL